MKVELTPEVLLTLIKNGIKNGRLDATVALIDVALEQLRGAEFTKPA